MTPAHVVAAKSSRSVAARKLNEAQQARDGGTVGLATLRGGRDDVAISAWRIVLIRGLGEHGGKHPDTI